MLFSFLLLLSVFLEVTVNTRREKKRSPTTLVAILNLRARSRGHASTNQTFFASERLSDFICLSLVRVPESTVN